jgi:hypothetical protein
MEEKKSPFQDKLFNKQFIFINVLLGVAILCAAVVFLKMFWVDNKIPSKASPETRKNPCVFITDDTPFESSQAINCGFLNESLDYKLFIGKLSDVFVKQNKLYVVADYGLSKATYFAGFYNTFDFKVFPIKEIPKKILTPDSSTAHIVLYPVDNGLLMKLTSYVGKYAQFHVKIPDRAFITKLTERAKDQRNALYKPGIEALIRYSSSCLSDMTKGDNIVDKIEGMFSKTSNQQAVVKCWPILTNIDLYP